MSLTVQYLNNFLNLNSSQCKFDIIVHKLKAYRSKIIGCEDESSGAFRCHLNYHTGKVMRGYGVQLESGPY